MTVDLSYPSAETSEREVFEKGGREYYTQEVKMMEGEGNREKLMMGGWWM